MMRLNEELENYEMVNYFTKTHTHTYIKMR